MGTLVAARSTGRAAGLTLIEVLATVLVMGLGLVMVGAAFPVGIAQTRMTVMDTQATMVAHSAAQVVRMGNDFMKSALAINLPINASTPFGAALDVSDSTATWRVGNPQRLAYGLSGNSWKESALLPTVPGDLVCIPVVMRVGGQLSATSQSPLFKLTLFVVVQHGADIGPPYEQKTVSGSGVNLGPSNSLGGVKVGDYVMPMSDPSGNCYQVTAVSSVAGATTVTLNGTPTLGSGPVYLFYDVAGVFYTYIDG